MASIYLDIDLNEFEKRKKEAIECAEANGSDNHATFKQVNWTIDGANTEINDDGSIYLSGDIGKLGYLSLDFSLDLEDISELIEFYIKKLNRLKTVLEATK